MVARGFPDISANGELVSLLNFELKAPLIALFAICIGANYITSLNGSFYKLYGTSASTPVLAAIIALINDARHAHGKGSVGFINPAVRPRCSRFTLSNTDSFLHSFIPMLSRPQ